MIRNLNLHSTALNVLIALLLLAFPFAVLGQDTPFLVKDINPGPCPPTATNASNFLVIGDVAYFAAYDAKTGTELWKTDGTDSGTFLVKDIAPGNASSSPTWFTNVNGVLFFVANDGTTGAELWKSDGTAEGTVLVKDIWPGSNGSSCSSLAAMNGTLFFSANDGVTGNELWKSDGSTEGTLLIKDIMSGSSGYGPRSFTGVNGVLFFVAGVAQLWKTTGTPESTVLVKNVAPSASYPFAIHNLIYFTNSLYFSHGDELWKSDGTSTGTFMVKDMYTPNTDDCLLHDFTVANDILFFTFDWNDAHWLYKTDGTAGGTVYITAGNPSSLTSINGTLYFNLSFGFPGYKELWKYSGSSAVLVKKFNFWAQSISLTEVNGLAFFEAYDSVYGSELWKSNGTEAGTVLVKDIRPEGGSSSPENLINLNGTLLFVANDGIHGKKIWRSDGTEFGTTLLMDQNVATDSSPSLLTRVNSQIFFTATDEVNGNELWKSNGTESGTFIVEDLVPGAYHSSLTYMTEFNDKLYFVRNQQLWESNGTIDGTDTVSEMTPCSNLFSSGDALYFWVATQLWKYDKTENLTVLYTASPPDGHVASARGFAKAGSSVYLAIATHNFNTVGSANFLIKTNGTPEGTALIADHTFTSLTGMTGSGNSLFFQANNGTSGAELWMSDGTTEGTKIVKDIYPGGSTSHSSPSRLTDLNGTLFFTANDGVHGVELWKSDGTDAGTVLVKDICPGNAGSSPANLCAIGSTLYFSASDGVNGIELWKTNGTPEGTVMVRDIYWGAAGSAPANLINADGLLFFTANDGVHGIELWKSNGTEQATRMIGEICPGPEGSEPLSLACLNHIVYFSATDGTTQGRELWACAATPFSMGSLRINVRPQAAIDKGAKWRLSGTRAWHDSGATLNGIPVGPIDVEFKKINEWNVPATLTPSIVKSKGITLSGTYTQNDTEATNWEGYQ